MKKNENDVKALKALIAEQNANGAGISEDLNGWQYGWNSAGRLVSIDLPVSGLKGHVSLSGFPELERLNVPQCGITSLDVSACPKLEYLNCFDNRLEGLDVTHNPALKTLRCRRNRITELDLSNNPALETLSCASRRLESIRLNKNAALTLDKNALRGVRLDYVNGPDEELDEREEDGYEKE